MRRLVLAVAAVAALVGALWVARLGTDEPQDAYSIAFPPSWTRVESNREWNHAKTTGAVIVIRSVHAIRNRRWLVFQFATSAHDEALFADELLASERSIRWVRQR